MTIWPPASQRRWAFIFRDETILKALVLGSMHFESVKDSHKSARTFRLSPVRKSLMESFADRQRPINRGRHLLNRAPTPSLAGK